MDREYLESEDAICIADDLVSLAQLTDHSILNCLRERFNDDQIYVSIPKGRVEGNSCKHLTPYRAVLATDNDVDSVYNVLLMLLHVRHLPGQVCSAISIG